MKPVRTWIVIADGARARFLLHAGLGKGFAPAIDEEMRQELPPNREMVTDRPGRMPDAGVGRSALTPTVDWHEFEKGRFAHQVAQVLNKARACGEFDRLVLVAPPKSLGHLRDELDKQTRAMITGELDKDLTNIDDKKLGDYLGEIMAL